MIFLEKVGETSKYHETITVFFLLLTKHRLERLGKNDTWEEFKLANPELFDPSRNILSEYYRPGTLSSALARHMYVAPDLASISPAVRLRV